MEWNAWLAFAAIAFIATVTPGPAILLVVVHSLRFGMRRAIFTIFGNVTGLIIMSTGSVLGLSALLLYSSFAFTVIKIVGALYLFYLGVKLWRSGVQLKVENGQIPTESNAVSLYAQGVLVALTNPKAIVFTTALFPQFISTQIPLAPQFSLLVITFASLSFLCLFAYSALAKFLSTRARHSSSGKWIGRVVGSTFIGAGSAILISSR